MTGQCSNDDCEAGGAAQGSRVITDYQKALMDTLLGPGWNMKTPNWTEANDLVSLLNILFEYTNYRTNQQLNLKRLFFFPVDATAAHRVLKYVLIQKPLSEGDNDKYRPALEENIRHLENIFHAVSLQTDGVAPQSTGGHQPEEPPKTSATVQAQGGTQDDENLWASSGNEAKKRKFAQLETAISSVKEADADEVEAICSWVLRQLNKMPNKYSSFSAEEQREYERLTKKAESMLRKHGAPVSGIVTLPGFKKAFDEIAIDYADHRIDAEEAKDAGNKIVAILGRMDLHGRDKDERDRIVKEMSVIIQSWGQDKSHSSKPISENYETAGFFNQFGKFSRNPALAAKGGILWAGSGIPEGTPEARRNWLKRPWENHTSNYNNPEGESSTAVDWKEDVSEEALLEFKKELLEALEKIGSLITKIRNDAKREKLAKEFNILFNKVETVF